MGGSESFQAIKTHLYQSPEQVASPLGRTEEKGGAEKKKTLPERTKQVAIVMVSIILSAFTIIYKSQAHFSLSQPWEVSIAISSILPMLQNTKLRLRDMKSLLWIIGKLDGSSSGNSSWSSD